MLKSLNKLSSCYKLNLNVSTTTTCQLLYYTKTGGTGANSHSGPFTKRNSYTHKQDVRKIKRRELRSSDEPADIIVDTKPTAQPKVKPSHLHSKPISHDTKLQQLEHHHQKKLERIEKQKEQQRNQLIESLTLDQQQEQKKIHDDQLQQQESNQSLENERSSKKFKRQLSQQERLKQIQYGIDHEEEEEDDSTTSTDSSSSNSSSSTSSTSSFSEGRPEYSNKLSTNGETSFETDLSYYDLNSSKSTSKITIPIEPLDFSKINPNDVIDIDEMDLSNFEKDDSVNEDARIMTIEDAHKRFKFTDQELTMLLKHAKEQKEQQQQQQSSTDTIDEGNEYEQYEEEIEEDDEAQALKEEISNYERLLNEKKEKLLEKEARKQFKSDLALSKEEIKQAKKLKKQQDKLLKKQTKQMKKKSYLDQQQQELVQSESISTTQQDLMSKQKVIQHIQTLHAKKVKEANIKERDLTPLKINEVMEFLAETQLDDFCVVDVSKKCSWAKYLVIASSDSTRLLSNTEDDIIHHFRNRFEQLSTNSQNSDEWRVVDLKTVVIHLFETKTREHYDLETLWVTRRELDSTLEESWDDEMTSKIGEDDEDD